MMKNFFKIISTILFSIGCSSSEELKYPLTDEDTKKWRFRHLEDIKHDNDFIYFNNAILVDQWNGNKDIQMLSNEEIVKLNIDYKKDRYYYIIRGLKYPNGNELEKQFSYSPSSKGLIVKFIAKRQPVSDSFNFLQCYYVVDVENKIKKLRVGLIRH